VDALEIAAGHIEANRFGRIIAGEPYLSGRIAFNGRSMPIAWLACMSGVPALALPKIRSSVGRSGKPTSAAPAA